IWASFTTSNVVFLIAIACFSKSLTRVGHGKQYGENALSRIFGVLCSGKNSLSKRYCNYIFFDDSISSSYVYYTLTKEQPPWRRKLCRPASRRSKLCTRST